ncbi:DNA-cytosine methyltransferase [Methylorubrum populi BJ001]|jgi:DNA (cytosine-5)-methyltransferase 1|uniref:Cytosine-specific methyltransferase n=1 Tax=Methylorubrum populi (strain ATCC BAA-705 / NCIMB 13946 / BJ001) TaxID=441620 RepID=B1ZJA5_METPB|nr:MULTISPECIES: DNA cytosine methyltransferase [Methylorubrum]ACB80010.1 DNA-cytosine methyltransferase [Methylorubrum populi BJ001]MBI1691935.1 DNA cytosine methyltransferase [Methylorubrum sp. DB1722]
MTRPIGIDLFSGAGGLSLGFEQAGFDVRAAAEIDPVHAAVHKFNFPNCAVLARSVVGLTAAEIREAAALGPSDRVDVVFGGPPCQGFSMIGHRVLDDPRNRLVHEFVRLVHELDANYFLFENVKGLTVGKHRAFLDELVTAFRNVGYDVALPWQVLDAADFGVPQHRERLILLGARRGLPLPVYPLPTTRPADRLPGLQDLPVGPSCLDALDDLPDADAFEVLDLTDAVRTVAYKAPSRYASEMRGLSNNAWHYGYPRKWDPGLMTSSWRTEHTPVSQARFAATRPGQTEPISRFYKLRPDGLSNTLRAGTDGARGAFTSPRPIHYARPRCVTVREMARLHGFPDWFRFQWTKWHGARQIGNAVPPPLARAVAAEIVRALGVEPKRQRKAMALGAVDLLYMGMSEAARHFGVPSPPSKRDRKSGARKRSQRETEEARLAALAECRG